MIPGPEIGDQVIVHPQQTRQGPPPQPLVQMVIAIVGLAAPREKSGGLLQPAGEPARCRPGPFLQRQPLQVEERGPAGKTFRQGAQHLPLLGAGEQELPGRGSGAVHVALDRGHHFRRVLDLVEDDRRRVVAQKEVRVLAGVFQVDARVEHHVIVAGKQMLQQGGLADLPGAADHGHGKGLGQTDDAL